MQNNKAFSFVEIIIVISIISLLTVIGISSKQGYDENMYNTKIVSDIQTINNALDAYKQETKTLPMPGGNNNFFKVNTNYSHSYEDSETFGVYGSVTENTIAKRYLDILPLDPRTSNYYSYGKTKTTNQFEIATIQIISDDPVAKVTGNYTAEVGPYNLIRAYNNANFVDNGSKTNLPYNPDELAMIVTTASGVIYREGDIIRADDGDLELFFSDGSVSILEDGGKLTLYKLDFPTEDNLNTIVKLALEVGTIWTKATHLNENSEFEVYTADSTAAVRGTVFGITKDTNETKTIVVEGAVDVFQASIRDYEFQTNIFNENIQLGDKLSNTGIVVEKGEEPKEIISIFEDIKIELADDSDYKLDTLDITEDATLEDIEENLNNFSESEYVRDPETEEAVNVDGEEDLLFNQLKEDSLDDWELIMYDGFDEDYSAVPAAGAGTAGTPRKHWLFNDNMEVSSQNENSEIIGFTISDGILNASGTNGYLKYDDVNLGNDDEFVIEVNAEITDLGNKYILSGTGFNLFVESKILKYNDGSGASNYPYPIEVQLNKFTSFYIKRDSLNRIFIKHSGSDWENTGFTHDTDLDDILIGSKELSGVYVLQINDNIDYVKIYKD